MSFRGYTESKHVDVTVFRWRTSSAFGSEDWIAKSAIVAAIPRRNHRDGDYEGRPVSVQTMIFNNYTFNNLILAYQILV